MNSHKTARHRRVMSKPVRFLLSEDLIKGNVLDYGCGRGRDVLELRKLGFQVSGYDPHYFPRTPRRTFRTVLMTYVVNTLKPIDAKRIVNGVWNHVARDGTLFITARSKYDVDYEAEKGDWNKAYPFGYFTNTGTYQYGYTTSGTAHLPNIMWLTLGLLCQYKKTNWKKFATRQVFPISKAGGAMIAITKRTS